MTADPIRFEDVAHLDLVGFPMLGNRRAPGRAVWCVVLDDYGIGRQAVDYLYALGHRSVAHLAGPPGLDDVGRPPARLPRRPAGVRPRRRPRGGEGGPEGLRDAPVAFGSFTYGLTGDYQSGADGMRALLERTPRPTAVFAGRPDHLAVGAYHAIRDAGLRVGEDVSVVAVAGTALAALEPPLTAFDHQRQELGVQAVELLLAQPRESPTLRARRRARGVRVCRAGHAGRAREPAATWNGVPEGLAVEQRRRRDEGKP